jgi:hypothetical protein
MAGLSEGKNTHTAERPPACDSIGGNKSTALFPRIKSQAAGRSAPRRCMCVFTLRRGSAVARLLGLRLRIPLGGMDVCLV